MTAPEYTALCNKLNAALTYIENANELIRRAQQLNKLDATLTYIENANERIRRAKQLLYDLQEALDPPAE